MKTAKEQFLLDWDEGDTDNPPTKMERDLEKVIIESHQSLPEITDEKIRKWIKWYKSKQKKRIK
jgi:hypothetical protein